MKFLGSRLEAANGKKESQKTEKLKKCGECRKALDRAVLIKLFFLIYICP